MELAILDLLGQVSGRALGGLFGGVKRREIAVYRASSHRGNAPEEELEYLQRVRAEKGVARVPTGPGLGVVFDPAFLTAARVLEG